jgi:hypothetical protein
MASPYDQTSPGMGGIAKTCFTLTLWASNGRKTGEGSGSGTGVPALSYGSGWKAFDGASGLFITLAA